MKRLALRNIIKPARILARTYYEGAASEPFHPIPNRKPKYMSADEAVKVVKSGDCVYVHGAAATPLPLLESLAAHGKSGELKDVELIHIHTEGPGICQQPEYEGIFRSVSLFTGANCRKAIEEGRADYVPIFLGEVPLLFRRNVVNIDVALVHVSPPDTHGFCSLGPSVDCTRAAIQNAKYIIGLCNPQCPRTYGDGQIHQSHLDAFVYMDHPLPVAHKKEPSKEDAIIGSIIAENLVENGATLQMGIGSIPDAVLASLTGHTDLGVHTEMFSDGIVDLVEKGVITNAQKVIHPGKIVTGFVVGTKRVFDFIHNNPFVVMCDISFVNNVSVIASNPKVTAINSCIEVDLTGQVVSDSIGYRIYSGVGGQIDFLRGAALCQDGKGKPILAMPSATKKGQSKIVPFVKEGGGIVTSRAHTHYLVTEYGIAYLFGKSLRQRAHALIQVAHPDHREYLERCAFERLKCMPSP
eukprot:Seg644.2 transcript_id=Seg644.2/GoldUCD/mRNA.D3Y31 product="4-hydroxybutyrate coenzyme A transferase" protein_id=Seg644.2/GoldUCD/D3Y31